MASKENKPPQHIAFIMDGNGRWAEQKGKPRTYGHRAGAQNVETVISYLRQRQMPYVSLYAFSTENWTRSGWEIRTIMKLFEQFSGSAIRKFVDAGIKVRFIGRRDRLTPSLQSAMARLERATLEGEAMLLQVAVDYGGRDEILRAVNTAIKGGRELSEVEFGELLDTRLVPDPDLVIRTGGNQRFSNFMPWQTVYTEWQFTDTLWPELSVAEIELMIDLYMGIERRYGSVPTAAE